MGNEVGRVRVNLLVRQNLELLPFWQDDVCQLQCALGLAAVRRETVMVERECIGSKGGIEEAPEDCPGEGGVQLALWAP